MIGPSSITTKTKFKMQRLCGHEWSENLSKGMVVSSETFSFFCHKFSTDGIFIRFYPVWGILSFFLVILPMG